jgi:ribosomal protein S18 acetylase RimI-like enzyme
VISRAAVRPGAPSDVERCVALARLAAPERNAEDWRGSLSRDLGAPDRLLVVAELEGAIVGYGRARLFEPEPDAPVDVVPAGYYLTGLFVVANHRRGGIGAGLTQGRLAWIAERADEAWYFANARNTASVELHRRFGFEEVTRRFTYPGVTFAGGEGILFRLRLDAKASRA